MAESVLTTVNLVIFAVCFTVGFAKAAAARRDPDTALRITSSVLLCASGVYLLSAPAVYRLVGDRTGSPSLPSLLVSIGIVVCIAHAHALTLLWHPRRRSPGAMRHSVIVWGPVYGLAVTSMTVLFVAADLSGPARPLSFAVSYAHVPAACVFELVYLTAMVVGITATVRQCRGPDGVIALPARPDLADSLRQFAVAVGLDLAYVAFTAAAVLTAALRGPPRLAGRAGLGGQQHQRSDRQLRAGQARARRTGGRPDRPPCSGPAVAGRRGRRRQTPPRMNWWNPRYALADMIAEILDGTYRLSPWMDPAAGRAVRKLAAADPGCTELDVRALEAAAAIRVARPRHDAALRSGLPVPQGQGPLRADTPPTRERARQVQIAAHLSHPLVDQALRQVTGQAVDAPK
ncbi:hypothetical protein SHKM778_48530 [Streptomyces sp. KM77-8]|uniref:DUF6545 domain-containing protein n=1 Tax=Streptomyces haneummycinicus TaxID=3074435 RepID=A0AAT9HLY5_9ACTN